ncbi:MAG: nitroreductase family protein, partial [Bacilli bacterium]
QRKSYRAYDPSIKIDVEDIKRMISLASLAPSAYNLQSWQVVAVVNQEVKDQLKEASFNQQQVQDASVVFVVFANKLAYLNIAKIQDKAIAHGVLPKEMRDSSIKQVMDFYNTASPARVAQSAITNASLFAMQLILIIKDFGYDSVPMGGFNPEKVSTILGKDDNHIPIVMIPAGKSISDAYETIRFDVDEILTIV